MKNSILGITMKALTAFAVTLLAFSSCKTDLDEVNDRLDKLEDRVTALEKSVAEINGNITSFKTLIDEITEGKLIISRVEPTDDGYKIYFSNSEDPIELKNGKNGEDGSDGMSPSVSIEYDSETGNYYWKVNGEFLLDTDNNKIAVNGQDAPTPTLEIGANLGASYEADAWYITVDDGATWTRVSASADELKFELEIVDNEMVITFPDGSEIKVPFVAEFFFIPEQTSVLLAMGETTEMSVNQNKVTNTMVTKPDGWKVAVTGDIISITAPDAGNSYAELTGTVSFLAASQGNFMTFSNITVSAYDPALGFSGDVLMSLSEEEALEFETLAVSGNLTEEMWEAIRKFQNITELVISEDDGALPDDIFGVRSTSATPILPNVEKISAPYITALGDHSLRFLPELVSVDFPSVISLGRYAIANNKSLTEVKLPAATTFGNYALANCAVIEEVNFPSAETMGVSCFLHDESLVKAILPNVTSFDNSVLNTCGNLTEVFLPNLVSAGNWCFQYCSSLETIELPELTSIGNDTFYLCESLKNVSMPKLTELPQKTFESCGIEILNMPGIETVGLEVFKNAKSLKEVYLPNATNFGNYVFNGCESLETIDMSGATTIGVGCIMQTPALINITMPLLEELPNYAFANSGIKSISLPALKTTGQNCFEYSGIETVDFPELESLGGTYVFRQCQSLISITLPKLKVGNSNTFLKTYNLETVDFPLIEAIPSTMFDYCYRLKIVNAPLAQSIGTYAFEDCTDLESVHFPLVETVGGNAFRGCTSLKNVELDKATSFATNSFMNCISLETMLLGAQDAITFTGAVFNLTIADEDPITEGVDLALSSTGVEAGNVSGNDWNGYAWKSIATF